MYHAAQQMRVQQSLDVHSTAGKSAVSRPHSEPAISTSRHVAAQARRRCFAL